MSMQDVIVVEFNLKEKSFKKCVLHDIDRNAEDKDKIYWIHCDLNQKKTLQSVIDQLHLPSDISKLQQEQDSMVKIIDTDIALSLRIQYLLSTELNINNEVNFGYFIIHLTSRFCFTASTDPAPFLEEFMDSFQKSLRYAMTPCFILFLLFDSIVNDYAKLSYNFELITEDMDYLIRASHPDKYNDIMNVKQQLMKIKRNAIANRELIMRISVRKIAVISEQCRLSLHDLSNHSRLVFHEVDSILEMLNSLLDQIDNSLMQRMNESMRILTAFAAIFLPLTLITGIYGMNFKWIPELNWEYGYFYAIGLIFILGCLMFYFFKKNKWF